MTCYQTGSAICAGDDSERKRQLAAPDGSRDSFFFHHVEELKNSNYSVNSGILGVHWDKPGFAAVTTLKSQGISIMEVYFLLV